MPLQKKDRTLLVKLFYQNGNNSLAVVREYRHLKGKGSMSKYGLKKLIMNFEETGDLGVLPGIGRKPVANETVEEVATAVVGRASSSSISLASGRSVSRELEVLRSAVRKILRSNLK